MNSQKLIVTTLHPTEIYPQICNNNSLQEIHLTGLDEESTALLNILQNEEERSADFLQLEQLKTKRNAVCHAILAAYIQMDFLVSKQQLPTILEEELLCEPLYIHEQIEKMAELRKELYPLENTIQSMEQENAAKFEQMAQITETRKKWALAAENITMAFNSNVTNRESAQCIKSVTFEGLPALAIIAVLRGVRNNPLDSVAFVNIANKAIVKSFPYIKSSNVTFIKPTVSTLRVIDNSMHKLGHKINRSWLESTDTGGWLMLQITKPDSTTQKIFFKELDKKARMYAKEWIDSLRPQDEKENNSSSSPVRFEQKEGYGVPKKPISRQILKDIIVQPDNPLQRTTSAIVESEHSLQKTSSASDDLRLLKQQM